MTHVERSAVEPYHFTPIKLRGNSKHLFLKHSILTHSALLNSSLSHHLYHVPALTDTEHPRSRWIQQRLAYGEATNLYFRSRREEAHRHRSNHHYFNYRRRSVNQYGSLPCRRPEILNHRTSTFTTKSTTHASTIRASCGTNPKNVYEIELQGK